MSKNAGQTKKNLKTKEFNEIRLSRANAAFRWNLWFCFVFVWFGRRFCLCISKAFRFFWFFWVWPALFAHVCRDQPICSNSVRKPIRTSEPRRPVRTTNTISNRHWPACPEDGVHFVIYVLFWFVSICFKYLGATFWWKTIAFISCLDKKKGESRAPPPWTNQWPPNCISKNAGQTPKNQKNLNAFEIHEQKRRPNPKKQKKKF